MRECPLHVRTNDRERGRNLRSRILALFRGELASVVGELLGMRDDILNDARIANDLEVETPGAVDASLPPIFCLAVFLGTQGRVMEVGNQKTRLLVKSLADGGGKIV